MGNHGSTTTTNAKHKAVIDEGPFSASEFAALQASFGRIAAGKPVVTQTDFVAAIGGWLGAEEVGWLFVALAPPQSDAMPLLAFRDAVAKLTKARPVEQLKLLMTAAGASPRAFDASAADGTLRLVRRMLAAAGMAELVPEGADATLLFGACLHREEPAAAATGAGADEHAVSAVAHTDAAAAAAAHDSNAVLHWLQYTMPYLAHIVRGFFVGALLCAPAPTLPAAAMPVCAGGCPPSRILRPELCFALMLSCEEMHHEWELLFTSLEHGLSFSSIERQVLGYKGPTLLVVSTEAGDVLGGYASATWKESSRFYGTPACFLFSTHPTFHLQRASTAGCAEQNYMYLNRSSYGHPHGIGMGGSAEAPRLFLDAKLEACKATRTCLTYDIGPLARSDTFVPAEVEVWGLGGAAGREGLEKAREERAHMIERARKVDKAKLVETEFDRQMLFGKTFAQYEQR